MKTILKTVPKTLDMNYNETFTSGANVEIRRKLVPELLNSLKPKYHPTYEQLTQWLRSLHKTRRSRNIYRNKGQLDADNRRLHANNRLNEVWIFCFLYIYTYVYTFTITNFTYNSEKDSADEKCKVTLRK